MVILNIFCHYFKTKVKELVLIVFPFFFSFEKIFPTADSHDYLKYFESPQYYNKLFDAWETKYGDKREDG